MPWPQTGETHYLAQLGLSVKVRAIKGLVIRFVVWLLAMIYDLGDGSLDQRKVVGLVSDGFQAQVLQHPIDICRYNTIQIFIIWV